MSEKKFIRDLKDKEHFQSFFLVTDKNLGTDRNGKTYMSLQISDASGSMNARVFERVDELAGVFQNGDFIRLKGFVQSFQGRLQLIGQDVFKADPSEFQIGDLIRSTAGNLDDLTKKLRATIESLSDPFIKKLLQDVFADQEIEMLFVKAPAAKSIHHAYLGGLLEHVVSIMELMEALAKHYTFLNRDLLIFGAIFHDLGKIWELGFESGIQYTDRGRLVGHMGIACEIIDEKIAKIEGFPSELKDLLKHIVLSHHGKLEYGSPKLPMFPEVIMVAMIDDLDSKMNTISNFMTSEVSQLPKEQKWSRYHPGFERYFYLDFFRSKS